MLKPYFLLLEEDLAQTINLGWYKYTPYIVKCKIERCGNGILL